MNELIEYKNTDNIVKDACKIIDSAQKVAYKAVNSTLVIRNWLLGKRICEEELKGEKRAEYGNKFLSLLADELTKKYGKGFTHRTLYNYIRFYKLFPRISWSLTTKFTNCTDTSINQPDSINCNNIIPATNSLLSWTHYEKLLQVDDENARSWYEKEAYEQTWSVRTLQRNISSQYYYRMLKTQDKTGVENEMKELTSPYQDKLEFIKNPIIAEFLGMQENTSYYESDLEQSIINANVNIKM